MQQPDIRHTPQSDAKVAVLIDADNAPAAKIDAILSELAKYGVANIRRAYGNWKSPTLKSWEEVLHEYAILPIQQFNYTKGKNATDIAMTIDAMDLLYTQHLDAFCLVSSDGDFTPLVMRILTNGLKVYGFGEKKTPSPFVDACSTFLYLENLVQENDSEIAKDPASIKKTTNELKGDAKLVSLLRNAVESTQEDSGWSNLREVGIHISNRASFDSRNYGYKKLSELIEATDLFEIDRRDKYNVFIRDKRKIKQNIKK